MAIKASDYRALLLVQPIKRANSITKVRSSLGTTKLKKSSYLCFNVLLVILASIDILGTIITSKFYERIRSIFKYPG